MAKAQEQEFLLAMEVQGATLQAALALLLQAVQVQRLGEARLQAER
jgi:hypothetical protein